MASIFFTILPIVLTFTVAAWTPRSTNSTNPTEPSASALCTIC